MMKLAVAVVALVAFAAAADVPFASFLKQHKLSADLELVAEHEKVKAHILQTVPEEYCSVIYHIPEGKQGHLTTVNSKDGCLIDEPDYFTYHARSGTLVVFYNENEHDVTPTPGDSTDETDLSIRAWTGHAFPGEKLKPSISRGCRLCRRGYVHEFSRRIFDDCLDDSCICEKTGQTAAFDTVDRRGECSSTRGRAYFCACRDNCSVSETEQYCNVPLTHAALAANLRTTVSSSQYSDLSSSEWTESKSSDSHEGEGRDKETWTTWTSTSSSSESESSQSSERAPNTESESESESDSRSSWSSWTTESESESSESESNRHQGEGHNEGHNNEGRSDSSSWTWTRQ